MSYITYNSVIDMIVYVIFWKEIQVIEFSSLFHKGNQSQATSFAYNIVRTGEFFW